MTLKRPSKASSLSDCTTSIVAYGFITVKLSIRHVLKGKIQ